MILTNNGHDCKFEDKYNSNELHTNRHIHAVKFSSQCAQLQLSEILIVSISEKKDKQKFIKNDEKNGTKISKIVRKRERSKIYFSLATITIFLRHSCKTLRECFKFLKPLRNISKKFPKYCISDHTLSM